jgi:predicted permease
MIDSFLRDVRNALRSLWRSPVLSVAAILTLALGTGANAGIFSVFNQVVLRDLPVQEPEALVNLKSPEPKNGRRSTSGAGGGVEYVFSYPLFKDIAAMGSASAPNPFAGVAAHREFPANVTYERAAESATGQLVSGSYFPVLGLRPALGRLLGPDDDRTPGAHLVTVLTDSYWRTRFNRDPTVVGRTLSINGLTFTIVGIAPAGFEGMFLEQRLQLFVPLTMAPAMMPAWNPEGLSDRLDHWLYLFARLAPGVSRDSAAARANVPFRAILNEVELPLQTLSPAGMERFKARQLLLEDGSQGRRPQQDEMGGVLLLLLAVTGIVLLIACANTANLLLARAASRNTDMMVRVSVGATQAQLVRQMLVEALVLAIIGTMAGLVIAGWTLQALASLLSPDLRTMMEFRLDTTVLVFTAAVVAGTSIVFGLYPAIHGSRRGLADGLKGARTGDNRAAARFRTSVVTAQIALSMALLAVAGLFGRSLFNLSRIDLGLEADSLVGFRVSPELNRYTDLQNRQLLNRLTDELRALPGAESVSGSSLPLLTGWRSGSNVTVEGFQPGPDENMSVDYSGVGSDYFKTVGIPLLTGREFTENDRLGTPQVAIVNESFVRKFRIDSPIGRRMAFGRTTGPSLPIEIVGVVRDARYSGLRDAVQPQFYVPWRQRPQAGVLNFYIRTQLPPERLMAAIPTLVNRIDPLLPVEELQPMSEQLWQTAQVDRLIGRLAAGFSLLAALLAAIGLYGVLSFTVAQRTREIGLRVAFGAAASQVRRMVVASVARMLLVGGAAGIALALAVGRFAQSMLYEVAAVDPLIIAGALVVMAAVALAAGAIPALRASRIDPMTALRYE